MPATAQRDFVKLAIAPSQTEQEKAQRTHRLIREHLESDPELVKYRVDTFLQGSYKNSTNVRNDSDVDMGSLTNGIFYYDLDPLPTTPRYEYGRSLPSIKESVEESLNSLPSCKFTFWEYRADVLASLKRKYGDSVVDGNKAIQVCGNSSRLDADVLPCTSFRQYVQSGSEATYHTGIVFWSKSYDQIVNFPYQHYTNLTSKNVLTDGKVKGCIRIMKRLRNEFEDAGAWDRKRSPSCYLEGLIWNVPNRHFEGNYDLVMYNVLTYLWGDLTEKKKLGDLTSYKQANDIYFLFHPKFWNVEDALALIALIWSAAFSNE